MEPLVKRHLFLINEFLGFIAEYGHCNVRTSNTVEKRYIILSPAISFKMFSTCSWTVAMNVYYYGDLEDNKESALTFLG